VLLVTFNILTTDEGFERFQPPPNATIREETEDYLLQITNPKVGTISNSFLLIF
jgi:hypothetical protein